jgi:hypothetical protein
LGVGVGVGEPFGPPPRVGEGEGVAPPPPDGDAVAVAGGAPTVTVASGPFEGVIARVGVGAGEGDARYGERSTAGKSSTSMPSVAADMNARQISAGVEPPVMPSIGRLPSG